MNKLRKELKKDLQELGINPNKKLMKHYEEIFIAFATGKEDEVIGKYTNIQK